MQSERTEPMTTADFFNELYAILDATGKVPDILDYSLPCINPVSMRTYDFSFDTSLAYGGSEGIYIDLAITLYEDGKRVTHDVGTIKTLQEDDEAMHIMADMLADLIIAEYNYVNHNLDDFTWTGYDIYPLDDAGEKEGWGCTCATQETLDKKKAELLKEYHRVWVRDNETRLETIFT